MKFGIVGTGMIARIHARAIAEIQGAKLVACYDVVQDRADDFARQFGCRSYHDFRAFLDDPDMEIVNICTPSGLHREAALPAAASGRHLVIEKPLEITVSRCLEIVEACEHHRVVLSGIFPSRFSDAAKALKRTVESARFGKLSQGSAYVKWWREQSY
ncbi:MAG: Gfo/Idh/MocA family oxidoreductase, partial [Rectinema sp.]|nr:Gfo/Idh/MocA family oxidoreductase [Rectinema sp.]